MGSEKSETSEDSVPTYSTRNQNFVLNNNGTVDPKSPSTWGQVISGSVVRSREEYLEQVKSKGTTKKGLIQKEMGAPRLENRFEKAQKNWSFFVDESGSGMSSSSSRAASKSTVASSTDDVEMVDPSSLVPEDSNQRNLFIRLVALKVNYAETSKYGMTKNQIKLFCDGMIDEDALPETWHVIEGCKFVKVDEDYYPFQLQLSGHVRTVVDMDKMLNKILKKELKKKDSFLIDFKVLDTFNTASLRK